MLSLGLFLGVTLSVTEWSVLMCGGGRESWVKQNAIGYYHPRHENMDYG